MNWRFQIDGTVDPQTLPRIIGYFAQQWATPSRLVLQMCDGLLRIEVDVDGLGARQAEIVATKLRENVLIHDASVHSLPCAKTQ